MADNNGSGLTCKFHEAHESRLMQLEDRTDKQDQQINYIITDLIAKIERRVPPWVAYTFGGCGVMIGGLLGALATILTM